MFCYQCQEASKGVGCSVRGVCGKTDTVANLQDLLIYTVKGVAVFSSEIRKSNSISSEVNKYLLDSVFTTITNANFDDKAILEKIKKGIKMRDLLKQQLLKKGLTTSLQSHDVAVWNADSLEEFENKASSVGVLATENEDVRSLRELLTYGVKGIAAYAEHAFALGFYDDEVYTFVEKALLSTLLEMSVSDMVALVLECGKFGVQIMALLDKANTTTYGNPEITKVNIGVGSKPGILISGHDLRDMEDLLKQTENTGVDVYTHSEMLPAHYYPAFKKYKHFVGNYGSSWWKQIDDFETFNGIVLFTTNCIVPPRSTSTYSNRVYTTGAAGYPGFKHIEDRLPNGQKDFSELIIRAKECLPPQEIEHGEIVGGFAHNQVLALADKVVDVVKSGAIKKFVVMAGCDGRMKSREYYTDFAQSLPDDSVILTAGCAKYRYNKLQLGNIGGIPRVLDAGQCNDSYSLAVIALKLKEVFGLNDINSLPIVYNIAWYEQKAVIVLLALLFLGVKNIHLGPTLPAFLSPNVAKVLIEQFGIGTISTVENDIKTMIA
ncbi:MAG: hydroxylamine reductase [Paludibacteraceae bacterium]|nr:hydroxylamine reductase [Paludibacteraceae bacterium]